MSGLLVFLGSIAIVIGAALITPALGLLALGAWALWVAARIERKPK